MLDDLMPMVAEALEAGRLIRDRVVLPGDDAAARPGTPILGDSKPMQQVYKLIGQVAASDAPVLIRGETGTGKELIARAIYQHSRAGRQAVRRRQLRRHSRATCSKANCSATRRAPSPAPTASRSAGSSRPTAAPSSSTKSAT